MCESASGGIETKTDEVKIVQEEHQDPNSISWHTTVEITNASGPIMVDRHKGGRHRRELTQVGNDLVERLLKIGAIHTLELEPYKITVHKGPAFDWKAVNPQVQRALLTVVAKAANVPKSKIKVTHPDPS